MALSPASRNRRLGNERFSRACDPASGGVVIFFILEERGKGSSKTDPCRFTTGGMAHLSYHGVANIIPRCSGGSTMDRVSSVHSLQHEGSTHKIPFISTRITRSSRSPLTFIGRQRARLSTDAAGIGIWVIRSSMLTGKVRAYDAFHGPGVRATKE